MPIAAGFTPDLYSESVISEFIDIIKAQGGKYSNSDLRSLMYAISHGQTVLEPHKSTAKPFSQDPDIGDFIHSFARTSLVEYLKKQGVTWDPAADLRKIASKIDSSNKPSRDEILADIQNLLAASWGLSIGYADRSYECIDKRDADRCIEFLTNSEYVDPESVSYNGTRIKYKLNVPKDEIQVADMAVRTDLDAITSEYSEGMEVASSPTHIYRILCQIATKIEESETPSLSALVKTLKRIAEQLDPPATPEEVHDVQQLMERGELPQTYDQDDLSVIKSNYPLEKADIFYSFERNTDDYDSRGEEILSYPDTIDSQMKMKDRAPCTVLIVYPDVDFVNEYNAYGDYTGGPNGHKYDTSGKLIKGIWVQFKDYNDAELKELQSYGALLTNAQMDVKLREHGYPKQFSW